MRIITKVSLSEEESEFDGKSLNKEQLLALLACSVRGITWRLFVLIIIFLNSFFSKLICPHCNVITSTTRSPQAWKAKKKISRNSFLRGSGQVGDITPELLDAYILWRREIKQNSDATINHSLTPILKACAYACELLPFSYRLRPILFLEYSE